MSELLPLQGQATVVMIVKGQPIVVTVDGDNAPITAGNFVDLVERNIYEGVMFHRVVRQPSPFVVQGGDPNSRNTSIPANQLGTGNFVDPETNQPRFLPLEIKPQGAAKPVYNQIVNQQPQLPHTRGAIAMARRSSPLDSASSQFYFALDNLPELNGSYSVFGYVTQGLDVIDTIQQGDRVSTAKVIQGIIPSRVSTVLREPTLLNNFINQVNLANLPLRTLPLSDGTDIFQISVQEARQNASGILGRAGNDQITGSTNADVINGNQGSDTLSGEGGDDYLRGGKENDLISGGIGNDILNGNQGNDTIEGGVGDDFLRGGRDNDILTGGEGNDVLFGDGNADTLTGNAGADTFVVSVTGVGLTFEPNSVDTIVDFNVAQGDRIGVVGLDLSSVQFNQFGSDTLIQFVTGDRIAVVQNASPADVQRATFTVESSTAFLADALPPGDAALRIG